VPSASGCQPHGAAEAGAVAGPDRFAAHLLGRGGEAVEEEGRDQEQVHQHGIGGQHSAAAARSLGREERTHSCFSTPSTLPAAAC